MLTQIKNSLFFILSLLIFSCDSNRVYDEYHTLPKLWNNTEIQEFSYTSNDTVSNYDLIINIRNNEDYNFSNLFLVTEIYFPKGKVVADTLQYQMANPDGSFLGEGFTEVKHNKLLFKENFIFSEEGDYKVKIRQAMRRLDEVNGIEDLEGITEVGFRIESKED